MRAVPNDGVLVIGSVSADVTTFSSRLPEPGETFLGDAFTLMLGGKGANQAVAAGRAGAAAYFVGCVGKDIFAPLVTDELRASAVNIDYLRQVDDQTGIAHIRVDASGENNIVVVPLANSHLSTAQIDEAITALTDKCSVMLTQLEIPFALTMYAIRRAKEQNMQVVLDPAPAHELDESIWPLIDIVTPNETEAKLLTGITVTDTSSAIEAGQWFINRGVKTALITLAGAGSVLVSAAGHTFFEPFKVDVVDTTAAGDAFAGYLAAALAADCDLTAAIKHANGAGALTVTKRGASSSIPHSNEVLEFIAHS